MKQRIREVMKYAGPRMILHYPIDAIRYLIKKIMADTTHTDPSSLPRHVAIIMDGNGRWAKQRGLVRVFGHRNGTKSVKAATEACCEIGIPYLTLYAFSEENWNRPSAEVEALMKLLASSLKEQQKDLIRNGVRLTAIGNLGKLPESTRKMLNEAIKATSEGKNMTLTLALSYSGQEEIADTARAIAREAARGAIDPEKITPETIQSRLYDPSLPPVDLLIRTGGEMRISNFLLWQSAYAELIFEKAFWPDFGKENLLAALDEYRRRERRFGKTSEQLK